MWIRKSIMLSVLVMTTGMYGFGSSDLEDLKGLFDKQQEIERVEISGDGEEKHEAQEGSMYDMARALLAVLMG